LQKFNPQLIYVDEHNRVIDQRNTIKIQAVN